MTFLAFVAPLAAIGLVRGVDFLFKQPLGEKITACTGVIQKHDVRGR